MTAPRLHVLRAFLSSLSLILSLSVFSGCSDSNWLDLASFFGFQVPNNLGLATGRLAYQGMDSEARSLTITLDLSPGPFKSADIELNNFNLLYRTEFPDPIDHPFLQPGDHLEIDKIEVEEVGPSQFRVKIFPKLNLPFGPLPDTLLLDITYSNNADFFNTFGVIPLSKP